VVLVQEPATAKFDSMPRSAIDAGLADIVVPADELPGKFLPICNARRNRAAGRSIGSQDAGRLEKSSSCCALIRATIFPFTKEHPLPPN